MVVAPLACIAAQEHQAWLSTVMMSGDGDRTSVTDIKLILVGCSSLSALGDLDRGHQH